MQTIQPVASQILTVSELNQNVASLLERAIPLCWITGEVSNFTRAASGHWYFTLKDRQAQVRAVMFKSSTVATDFIPSEGEKIELRATVTLYAPRGEYQLSVENIRRAGLGNLYEAFLKLKQKLSEAGLFDVERKKSLPSFPKCIGIVTSAQAAALRDILTTLERRAPHVKVIIYPTPVQGNGSVAKIAQAIRLAATRAECDLLLVARGGGSIEDLWSFNDEQVALAMSECSIPIITGIGHETDLTIADFVADLRAPTPTGAAELAVNARADLLLQLKNETNRLSRTFRRLIDQQLQTLDIFTRRLVSPLTAIQHGRLNLASGRMKLKHALVTTTHLAVLRFERLKQRLKRQAPTVTHYRHQLRHMSIELSRNACHHTALKRQGLDNLRAHLEMLNPQRTLERGYAIVSDKKGKIIRKPNQFHTNDCISIRVAEGEVEVGIAGIQQKLC